MEEYKQNYYDEVGRVYENHVNKFIEFLRFQGKLDTPTKIDLADVDECIGYYMRLGKINYRASMESHLESIKNFYDYLSETGKVFDIFTQINYERYKNDIVNKYNLSEGKERETFSMDTIIEILTALDNMIDDNHESTNEKKSKYLQRTVLRLFIKLTLIAPAKKNIICGLRFKNFHNGFHQVCINNIDIAIPSGLRRDILSALKKAEERQNNNANGEDVFFDYISSGSFSMPQLNHWFCTFLKEADILDISRGKISYELEPIMKTAIKAMIERMVNPAIISKISGIKIASLETKYFNDSIKLDYHESLNQAINWEIAKNEYYYYI